MISGQECYIRRESGVIEVPNPLRIDLCDDYFELHCKLNQAAQNLVFTYMRRRQTTADGHCSCLVSHPPTDTIGNSAYSTQIGLQLDNMLCASASRGFCAYGGIHRTWLSGSGNISTTWNRSSDECGTGLPACSPIYTGDTSRFRDYTLSVGVDIQILHEITASREQQLLAQPIDIPPFTRPVLTVICSSVPSSAYTTRTTPSTTASTEPQTCQPCSQAVTPCPELGVTSPGSVTDPTRAVTTPVVTSLSDNDNMPSTTAVTRSSPSPDADGQTGRTSAKCDDDCGRQDTGIIAGKLHQTFKTTSKSFVMIVKCL